MISYRFSFEIKDANNNPPVKDPIKKLFPKTKEVGSLILSPKIKLNLIFF